MSGSVPSLAHVFQQFAVGVLLTKCVQAVVWTIRGSNSSRGKRSFSSSKRPHLLRGPPSLLSSWNENSFPALKWPGRGVHHAPPGAYVTWTEASLTCMSGVILPADTGYLRLSNRLLIASSFLIFITLQISYYVFLFY